jgi:hypothetical protein
MGHGTKDRNICCSSSSCIPICSNMVRNSMNCRMGRIPKKSKTDCNVCSSTMNCLDCMGHSSNRSCFQDPISSRKDFLRRLRQCLRLSGRIVFLQTSYQEWRLCLSCLRKDIFRKFWCG